MALQVHLDMCGLIMLLGASMSSIIYASIVYYFYCMYKVHTRCVNNVIKDLQSWWQYASQIFALLPTPLTDLRYFLPKIPWN